MPESFKTKSVLVADNGLFVALAETLAQSFGKVYYYSSWESQLPTSNRKWIGTGIPGVTRVDSIWEVMDDVDLFVFPDLFFGATQLHLQSLGKRVFGSRMGEELEIYRARAKRHMKELGINVGPYKVLTGLGALRDYLKDNPNQYIKIDQDCRGDMETFPAKKYKLVQRRLDKIAYYLGERQHLMKFIAEDEIPQAVPNLGYDGPTIDGKFPHGAMIGCEVKDKSYIGVVKEGDEIPEQIRDVNTKLGPTLKEYEYRNWLTIELSITKGGSYFAVDPTARWSSPPGELCQLMYTNLPEILWSGAAGKLVEPEFAGKYGAQLIIYTESAEDWQIVKFPERYKDQIKLRNMLVSKGDRFVIPQSVEIPEIGGICSVGGSVEDVVSECVEIAEQIKGDQLKAFPEALKSAQEALDDLAECGVKL